MTIDPLKIAGIKVLETIKEGKTVYQRDPAAKRAAVPSNCADSDACFKVATQVLAESGVIHLYSHAD